MTEPVYDYLCPMGDLMDKLSIENIKCHFANMSILAERQKPKPDHQIISEMELTARTSGEQRVRLKDEINRRLAEALERSHIGCAPEVRTYKLKGQRNA
jgi:hypothetical protein